jgi:hypothetical protein
MDGGAGERYKRTGEILPDSAIEEFKKFDSVFLGAVGHPDIEPGILEVGILLKTRFAPSTSTSTCARSSCTPTTSMPAPCGSSSSPSTTT